MASFARCDSRVSALAHGAGEGPCACRNRPTGRDPTRPDSQAPQSKLRRRGPRERRPSRGRSFGPGQSNDRIVKELDGDSPSWASVAHKGPNASDGDTISALSSVMGGINPVMTRTPGGSKIPPLIGLPLGWRPPDRRRAPGQRRSRSSMASASRSPGHSASTARQCSAAWTASPRSTASTARFRRVRWP